MVPLLSPYGEGLYTGIEQSVRGTVLFLCCSLASLLYSLRGVMDSGSSCKLGSSIGVRRIYQWFYCVPLVFCGCYCASLKASNDTIGYTLGIL